MQRPDVANTDSGDDALQIFASTLNLTEAEAAQIAARLEEIRRLAYELERQSAEEVRRRGVDNRKKVVYSLSLTPRD